MLFYKILANAAGLNDRVAAHDLVRAEDATIVAVTRAWVRMDYLHFIREICETLVDNTGSRSYEVIGIIYWVLSAQGRSDVLDDLPVYQCVPIPDFPFPMEKVREPGELAGA